MVLGRLGAAEADALRFAGCSHLKLRNTGFTVCPGRQCKLILDSHAPQVSSPSCYHTATAGDEALLTQQKCTRHCEQIMWLHPLMRWMREPQPGQGLV